MNQRWKHGSCWGQRLVLGSSTRQVDKKARLEKRQREFDVKHLSKVPQGGLVCGGTRGEESDTGCQAGTPWLGGLSPREVCSCRARKRVIGRHYRPAGVLNKV